MSANSAVTVLRSPSIAIEGSETSRPKRIAGAGEVGGEPSRCSVLPPSAAPQSPQSFDPGAFSAPHFEQGIASPLPHWEQNFLPTAFSAAHFEQRIELLSDKGMENAPFVSPRLAIKPARDARRRAKRYVDNRG